jgi:hypothetical protein
MIDNVLRMSTHFVVLRAHGLNLAASSKKPSLADQGFVFRGFVVVVYVA